MPRSLLVWLLLFSLSLHGCAGTPRVSQPTAPSEAVASLGNQSPQESEHPFRDWRKAHPVATAALIGLVAGSCAFVAFMAFVAAMLGSVH